jgi:hypothetical protein
MKTDPMITELTNIAKEIQSQSQYPKPLRIHQLQEADKVVQRLRRIKNQWEKQEHQYKQRRYEMVDGVANLSMLFEKLVANNDSPLINQIRQTIRGLAGEK